MPMIVPHQSQVGIATANGGQAAQHRSASAFMTPNRTATSEGLQHLARGMDRLGDALFRVGIERQRMQNATDMLADKVDYEDALREFDSNYRQTHQGVSARDAEEAYGQFHKEQYDKLQKKWGGNPFLMQGVDRMVEGIRQPSMQRAVAYRDQQEGIYKKSQLDASAVQTLRKFSDPSLAQAEKEAALRDHERSLRLFGAGQTFDPKTGQWVGGTDITADIMAFREKAARADIEGRLAVGDIEGAKLLVTRYGGGTGGRIGDRVAAYESGSQGVKAVGYDRNGGTSYGKYQLSSRQGSYQEWLDYLGRQGPEGKAAAERLRAAGDVNTGGRSGAAVDAYTREAEAHPELFERTQREYVEQTHYQPMLAKLPAELRRQVEGNAGLQEMAWSTAVQHGGAGGALILSRVWKEGMSDGDLVDAVYTARGDNFPSSTPEVRAAVQNRFGRERMLIRGMLRGAALSPEKAAAYRKTIDAQAHKKQVDDFLAGTAGLSAPERMALLEKQYGGKPEAREQYDAIRKGIMHDVSAQEAIKQFERKERKNSLLKKMESFAGLEPEQSFAKMQELAQSLPLDERDDFYKAANNLRNPGRYDDPLAVQEVTERLLNGEVVYLLAEYGPRLSPAMVKKLGNQAYQQALPSIKAAFVDAGNEFYSNSSNKMHAQGMGVPNVTAMWTHFLNRTDADEKVDIPRLRKEAQDFFKSVILNKPWSPANVHTIRGLQDKALEKYAGSWPEQGTEEYETTTNFLKEQKVEPESVFGKYTDEQLAKGYRKYRSMKRGGNPDGAGK